MLIISADVPSHVAHLVSVNNVYYVLCNSCFPSHMLIVCVCVCVCVCARALACMCVRARHTRLCVCVCVFVCVRQQLVAISL